MEFSMLRCGLRLEMDDDNVTGAKVSFVAPHRDIRIYFLAKNIVERF